MDGFSRSEIVLAVVAIVSLLGLLVATWRSNGTVRSLADAVKTQIPLETLDRLEVFGKGVPAVAVDTTNSLLDTVKLFVDDDGDALIDAIKEKIKQITDGEPNLPPADIVDKAMSLIKVDQPAFAHLVAQKRSLNATLKGQVLRVKPVTQTPNHLG